MAAPPVTDWRGDMADVADICGEDVARELCEKLPGIQLYVPKSPKEESRVNRLEKAAAERLIMHFGGDTLRVPSSRRSSRETFEAVEALIDKGLTTQEIALRLGITQAYVFKVRRQAGAPRIAHRPDPRQLPLFE